MSKRILFHASVLLSLACYPGEEFEQVEPGYEAIAGDPLGGECNPSGMQCGAYGNGECCSGHCVTTSETEARCASECSVGSECVSGCCAPVVTTSPTHASPATNAAAVLITPQRNPRATSDVEEGAPRQLGFTAR